MPTATQRLARIGLTAKGVLYALLAVLATRVATGNKTDADSQGALRAIAGEPLGSVVLAGLALGFAIYAGWQVFALRSCDTWRARAGAVARGFIWSGLAISAARFLFQAGAPPKQEQSMTARLMDLPPGPWLIVAGGIITVVVGLAFLRHIKDHRYMDNLRAMPGRTRAAVKSVTVTGITGKALVYALVGAFLVRAGLTHKPRSGIGLDGALSKLSQEPYGTYALVGVAAGLAAYAVWCWVRAAYEDVRRSNG